MRSIVALAALAVLAFITSAEALVVEDAASIEASEAGLEERQQERFIIPLALLSPEVSEDLEATRAGCQNYKTVLRALDIHFRQGKEVEYVVHDLVRQARMSPLCVVSIMDIDNKKHRYVLLTPAGDKVIRLRPNQAYSDWKDVDHLEYRFVYLKVDPYFAVGIYPDGEVVKSRSLVPLVGYAPTPSGRP